MQKGGCIMLTVYVYEQGAKITKEGEVLTVNLPDGTTQNVRINNIDRIIIYGNVQFTTQALTLLLWDNIPVSFLTLNGEYKGSLVTADGANCFRRIKQYEILNNKEKRLALACRIVYAKLYNGYVFIRNYHHHKTLENFGKYNHIVENVIQRCKIAATIQELMGYEGFGTKSYFAMYTALFGKQWNFTKRTKRPPLDPVNAMMSLGYTLVSTEIASLLESHGLDTSLGVYHSLEYGRQSLALDIVEEFRAVLVDRFVFQLLSQKIFKPDDFEYDEQKGCRFKKEALKEYLVRYNKLLNTDLGLKEPVTWRQLLWRQVERMVAFIDKDVEYMPLLYGEVYESSSGI